MLTRGLPRQPFGFNDFLWMTFTFCIQQQGLAAAGDKFRKLVLKNYSPVVFPVKTISSFVKANLSSPLEKRTNVSAFLS